MGNPAVVDRVAHVPHRRRKECGNTGLETASSQFALSSFLNGPADRATILSCDCRAYREAYSSRRRCDVRGVAWLPSGDDRMARLAIRHGGVALRDGCAP